MSGSQLDAIAGESVVMTLEDEVDVSRGDMLVRKKNIPVITNRFDALLGAEKQPSLVRWSMHCSAMVARPYSWMAINSGMVYVGTWGSASLTDRRVFVELEK